MAEEQNNAADNYIFREKIRHPSEANQWIIARDYAYTQYKSEDRFIPVTGSTVSKVQLKTKSYNYSKVQNENQWNNITDVIDKEAISLTDISPTPPAEDKELFNNMAIASGITTPIGFSVTDLFNTVTIDGVYNTNNLISLVPSEGQTMPSLVTNSIINAANVNCIPNDDIVVIPSFDTNDNLSLTVYEYSSSLPIVPTGASESVTPSAYKNIDFTYNITDQNPKTDILNIMTGNENNYNYITFDNIVSALTPITQIDIAVRGSNNNYYYYIDNENLTALNSLYGNGTILQRYECINFPEIPDFNYTWLICNNSTDNFVIQFNNNHIIQKWYKVSLSPKTDTIEIIYQETINTNLTESSDIVDYYSLGWMSTSTINFNNYASLKPFNMAYIAAASPDLTFQYQTDEDRKTKILGTTVTGAQITRTDNNKWAISTPIAVKTLTNTSSLPEITNLIKDGSNDNIYYYSNDNHRIFNIAITNNSTLTLTLLLADLQNEVRVNNRIFLWSKILDQLIINEPTIPLSNLYFKICLSNIQGEIAYPTNVSNPRRLIKQTTIQNVAYGNNKNNLWTLIRQYTTNMNFPYIYLEYSNSNKGKIHYYSANNSTIQTSSVYNKRIWFLKLSDDGVIVNTDIENIYLVDATKLTIPTQFKNLINDTYTTVTVSIIPSDPIPINYNWHEYQTTIRYYGADNKLLNVGDQYTPVYIKNGQFYPCVGLNDVEVSTTDPQNVEVWIDTTIS